MPANPYSSPRTSGELPQRKRGRWVSRLLEVLAVFCIVGILVALLLPATRGSREVARRVQCANNLKQIAIALRDYESVHHALPPAYTVDAEGKPLHSWRTLILPFMEDQALYDTIDLSKPWDDPVNKAARETFVPMYRCPSVDAPATHTTYLAIVAADGCFRPTEPRKLAEITDGHDLTLMIVEVDAEQAVSWMSPTDAAEHQILNLQTADKLSHPGRIQAASVDGRVHTVSPDSTTERIRAMISIAGNDDSLAGEVN